MRECFFKSPFSPNDLPQWTQLNFLTPLWVCLWRVRLLLLVNVFGQESQVIWSCSSVMNSSSVRRFLLTDVKLKALCSMQMHFYFHRHLVCPLWSTVLHQVHRRTTLMSTIWALFTNIILFLVWKMCEIKNMMTFLQNREERSVNILLNIRLWKVSLTCENLQQCNLLFISDENGG